MKIQIFILALVICMGCNQPNTSSTDATVESSVNVDSLMALFLDGWNNKDSAAIMNTMAPDAIVMNDSMIHKGSEAIATNWISGGVKVLSNIKTASVIKDASNDIVYDGGTYSLDLTIPGGPVLKEKGNYSLIWGKQSDGRWLLTLVHIEDVTRLPDIQK